MASAIHQAALKPFAVGLPRAWIPSAAGAPVGGSFRTEGDDDDKPRSVSLIEFTVSTVVSGLRIQGLRVARRWQIIARSDQRSTPLQVFGARRLFCRRAQRFSVEWLEQLKQFVVFADPAIVDTYGQVVVNRQEPLFESAIYKE